MYILSHILTEDKYTFKIPLATWNVSLIHLTFSEQKGYQFGEGGGRQGVIALTLEKFHKTGSSSQKNSQIFTHTIKPTVNPQKFIYSKIRTFSL